MKSFFGAQKALRLNYRSLLLSTSTSVGSGAIGQQRFYHGDDRQRLSKFWVPTGGIAPAEGIKEDAHALLIRAGFVRQAHAGLFQFLPLGLRVQEKLERLLDKHMTKLGASKLSLSTFSSEELWSKTGRLDSSSSELFRLEDRKGGKYLLSPTHEEEITSLVGSIVKSYKELPLRLYQISRKYRDEPRPRQGLLRTREFLMKDLYTFDASTEDALQTYETVRRAYAAFFNEFKIAYLTAEACSGEIGGDLSHEYHFPTSKGDDRIISCRSCDYVANEELAESRLTRQGGFSTETDPYLSETDSEGDSFTFENPTISATALEPNKADDIDLEMTAQQYGNQWIGITSDRNTIVQAFLPKEIHRATSSHDRKAQINPFMIRNLVPDLDLSVENPIALFKEHRRLMRDSDEDAFVPARVLRLVDMRYYLYTPIGFHGGLSSAMSITVGGQEIPVEEIAASEHDSVDLVRIETGDPCPNCEEGTLKVEVTVELGHTFHLGTRYSEPLNTTVATNPSQSTLMDSKQETDGEGRAATISNQVPIQMGCHGIGVSRLIAAVADSLADHKGLNWPSAMAPFHTVIVPTKGQEGEAAEVYDILSTTNISQVGNTIDTILDDRTKELGWKLKDADIIGYPVIVVVGRDWKKERKVEVQCRRLGLKDLVPSYELKVFVERLLAQL